MQKRPIPLRPGTLFLLLLASLFISEPVLSQQKPVQADSSEFYRDIEKFSKKRKSTKLLYGIFFRPVKAPPSTGVRKNKKYRPSQEYRQAEGKIIREIYITTLDPFGYSVTDTAKVNPEGLSKTGNNTHIRTQRITIRNLLLIRK